MLPEIADHSVKIIFYLTKRLSDQREDEIWVNAAGRIIFGKIYKYLYDETDHFPVGF